MPLSELGEVVSGSTPKTHVAAYWDGDIPWITPADLSNNQGPYFHGQLRKITKAGYNSCSTRMIPTGGILYSSRAPIGHCAIAPYPLCTNQGFKSLIPNQRLDSVYGYYALRYLTPEIVALGRGATFAEINKEMFESVRMPVPPLDEQKRIAALLDKADRLRRTRRYAHELSSTFLQSVFLEMFGDPATNPRGWDVRLLEDLTAIIDYGVTASAKGDPVGPKFLRITDIQDGQVNWETVPYCLCLERERRQASLKRGDIVFARTGATTGKSFHITTCPSDAVFASYLIRIRPNECINSYFLAEFFQTRSYWSQIAESASGSAQPGVNSTKLSMLKVIAPSLETQEKFAAVVQQTERLRVRQREASRQAEHLFHALLHSAFSDHAQPNMSDIKRFHLQGQAVEQF